MDATVTMKNPQTGALVATLDVRDGEPSGDEDLVRRYRRWLVDNPGDDRGALAYATRQGGYLAVDVQVR